MMLFVNVLLPQVLIMYSHVIQQLIEPTYKMTKFTQIFRIVSFPLLPIIIIIIKTISIYPLNQLIANPHTHPHKIERIRKHAEETKENKNRTS